jgi:hypothetical protein
MLRNVLVSFATTENGERYVKIHKLCVAIPNYGEIKAETVYCIFLALIKTVMETGCGLHLIMPSWGMCDEARRDCSQEALDVGASHLMFIDSDMVFPDNGILRLASLNKRIIGANYNRRTLPLTSTVKLSNREGQLIEVPGDQIPKQPFKCYAVATGFMLIQVDVFKELSRPWFYYEYLEGKDTTTGEDVGFCKKAREKGIDVWCDPTIEVRHIGDYAY